VSSFETLKLLHMSSAFLSIGGFTLRGYWMLTDNGHLQKRVTRMLPHLLDTVLLGSAIGMLVIWRVDPFSLSWLSAKIVALLVYIGLGMVAFRFGTSRRARWLAFALALLTVAYIVTVAYTKSPLGLLAGVFGQQTGAL
tara:strand:+ start:333999 stop:334415 length:417 start_codon:yes stop_codon:yes gene_type:complete